MPSKRRMLLAAVGVALSAPAFARESTPPAAEVVVAIEEPQEEAFLMARPAEPDANVPCELASCEVMTANTKSPSYDDVGEFASLAPLEP